MKSKNNALKVESPHFLRNTVGISSVEFFRGMGMPLSSGLPLAAGFFLDWAVTLGADSYRILFAAMALLLVVGLVFALKLHFPGDDEADPA